MLDLREALLQGQRTVLLATVIGGLELLVPEGVMVMTGNLRCCRGPGPIRTRNRRAPGRR